MSYQANAIAAQAHQINALRDMIAEGVSQDEAMEWLTRTVQIVGHLTPMGSKVLVTIADAQ